MKRLKLTALGGLDIRTESGAPVTLATRKSKALLVYLALAAGAPQPRGKLAALLWDRSAEDQARASLRQTLFTLRQALSSADGEVLAATSDSVWVSADAVDTDVRSFERLLQEATPASLARALDLYRGDFLEGFTLKAEPFEDWLMEQRTRLRECALEALTELAAHYAEAGDRARAIHAAHRLVTLDPLREAAHRRLIRLYAEDGQRHAAIKQYESCARALQGELGVEPQPETTALYQEILHHHPAPAPAKNDGETAQAAPGPRRMEQTIRFCTTHDGIRIAYATVGDGPPLVKAANWLNHLDYDWKTPVYRHLLEALAQDHFLVRYDERGNGLSDWEVADISFDALVDDLETVVDAVGLERFALFGMSQGCAVSIAYAVRHPERVTRLVLHGGYARGWRTQGSPEDVERQEALLTLTKSGWGQENPAFRAVFTTLFIPDASPEQKQWFNDMQRVSTSAENAVRLQQAFADIDVTPFLPRVEAPTLVLHSRGESRIPFARGRELAAGIPRARFVPLESRNHVILEHEPAWPRWIAEVRDFLADDGKAGA
ncbi:MAG: alpha/beta fold hydrolase [Gammaproteobacteria bacterium]|nr:alpha/beta fold hydrolase [Gammaproteobacteria bacterium]NIR85904.1 alpha/beta fold hydrolase [Gammaproteobacteria bacterium]NIR91896.1 alpha/beta fold hydrolase [Gammaproteobacteria bacterium]NIU07153.1 alpha/beta fold hydrolase [Gammaproteobacteria bacterium]NIV53966.1 alpha/beta fold hydrolase [Gammaproteobacteria bacterium]